MRKDERGVIIPGVNFWKKDIVAGLEAGADEYLTKPVDQAALVARVKSMLRIKELPDMVQEQAMRLEAQFVIFPIACQHRS